MTGGATGKKRMATTVAPHAGFSRKGALTMSDIMKGASIKGVTRPSKDFGEGRVCRSKDCVTKLSRYNRREFCFAHAPVKYPRVRGRILPEGV
jgi:hypothetical protein